MGKDIQEEGKFRETREQQPDSHEPLHYSEEEDDLVLGRGSVRQGSCLIIGAVAMVLFFSILAGFEGVLYWYYLVLQLGLASLAIAVGLKLIRGARGRSRK